MKDQYVGDMNDYLKYALLRSLSADGRDLAVVWMLTASDERTDGLRLGYLRQPKFRALDPPLFDALGALVRSGDRSIRAIEESALLGRARFASRLLDDDTAHRRRYFAHVLAESAGRDLVFFDPDNGIEVASVRKGRRGSCKYVYWDELASTFERGQSLITYQHFPRKPRRAYLDELASRAHIETGCRELLAVATPHVAFLIFPRPEERDRLHARVASFAARSTPHATLVAVSAPDA